MLRAHAIGNQKQGSSSFGHRAWVQEWEGEPIEREIDDFARIGVLCLNDGPQSIHSASPRVRSSMSESESTEKECDAANRKTPMTLIEYISAGQLLGQRQVISVY